jgi:hypothetical protein
LAFGSPVAFEVPPALLELGQCLASGRNMRAHAHDFFPRDLLSNVGQLLFDFAGH